jgi:LAS superfamily LD-carboxypeptidase LdcB
MKYVSIKTILLLIFLSGIIFFVGIFILKKIQNIKQYNQNTPINNLQENDIKIIPIDKKDQPEEILNKEKISEKDKIVSTTCPQPTKEYEDMSLLNIGQNVGLPDAKYIPKGLEELNTESSTKKEVCLIDVVKDSFLSIIKDAKDAGYSIKASSAFRTYDTQKILFDNAVNSGKADALISLAKPGYSEHQLGTTVDVTSASINYASASGDFYKTADSAWLKEHAYLYGFIQSYPSGKESITGYKSEPWHYRYVGIENAKKIKDSGLTITEFLK